MPTFKKYIRQPVFYLSVIVLILFFIVPFPFQKYDIESTFKVFNSERLQRVYCDFDDDGTSEFLRFFSSAITRSGFRIVLTHNDGSLIYREMMPEKYGDKHPLDQVYFDVLDDSGYKSAAFFSRNNDSLYFFVFSYQDTAFLVMGDPVKKLPQNDEFYNSGINWLGKSKNNEGETILYFWIDNSFAQNMSELCAYNLQTGEFKSYEFEALYPQIKMLNVDSINVQIIINTLSNKNILDEFAWEYSSLECKLKFLDGDFNAYREPLVLSESYGYADIEILKEDEEGANPDMYVCFWDFSITNKKRKLLKLNTSGDTVFSKDISVNGLEKDLICIPDKEKELYIVTESKEYWLIDKTNGTLSKPLKTKLNLDGNKYISTVQLNNSPGNEHILFNEQTNELRILQSGFKNPASLVLQDENFYFDQMDIRKADVYSIALPGEVYYNRYNYSKTIWNWLQYPLWISLFILLNIVLWLRKRFKIKKANEIKMIEQRITDLQLKNFRNQLDPHFTFNALNVIGSVIYKEDRDVAYDYFTRFSRLMRSNLVDSTKITRELEAELQFTIDYLEFQKYRFKDKFEYILDVDDHIDRSMPVPKMLIQGYAENAVRHAFHLIPYKGLLNIKLNKRDDGFVISIRDNGIGRAAAGKSNTSKNSGRGMGVMEEQLNLFNKYNSVELTLNVIDLMENGKATGTLIEIFIPENYSFNISKSNKT